MDLARNAKGEWVGAFSQPAQGMRGLPLSSVTVEGATVRFLVGAGAGASTFTGTVADGKTIAGDATSPLGTAPFKLTRTGDAVIEAPPRGALVSKSLEGNWEGTLEVAGAAAATRPQDRQSGRWHFAGHRRQPGSGRAGASGAGHGERRRRDVGGEDDQGLVRGRVERGRLRDGGHVHARPQLPAVDVSQGRQIGDGRQPLRTSRIAPSAAAIVRAMSRSVCAAEMNHASNWDGGG